MQKDLTTGSVFKNVLYFSLPYLLSYFLQTLYGMADLFIIGQFEGTASITAVSIGSQIMHMITVMLVGLAMGVTVGIGRAVGAHDDRGAGAVIGPNSILEKAEIGAGTTVNNSQVYESKVGEKVTVGPFAYIRPQCVVGDGCRIGDFVELK